MRRMADMLEGVALSASAACLAHCLALPFILVLLPALATAVPLPTHFHIVALALAIPTTLAALAAGYRHHGALLPPIAGAGGLLLLAIGVLVWGETLWEVPFTVAGSLAIAFAHITNWRLRRRAHAGG